MHWREAIDVTIAGTRTDHEQKAVEHEPAISRRRLLAAGAGIGGTLLLGGAGTQVARGQDATPAAMTHDSTMMGMSGSTPLVPAPGIWTPEELTEPEVRQSAGGVLETTLRVGYATRDVGGYRMHVRAYEGMTPGPTLRVQPGDTLKITIVNELPANRDPHPEDSNVPSHFNTTNLHLHGLHVSPQDDSDNVFRAMEPGGTYETEIAIPADHPRGTYWYHPHAHGAADIQIASGMAGALIVEGDFADVPEIAQARERLLVLSTVVFDAWREVESIDTIFPSAGTRFFTVNGQREPTVRMRPGEVQRWRMVNAGYEHDLNLALDGLAVHAIARDGIPLARIDQPAVPPDSGTAAATSPLLIAPAQRIDVLVLAGKPGTYTLQAMPYDQGYPSPTGPIATIVVEGDPLPMALPASLPSVPLATIGDDELTGRRELSFSHVAPEVHNAGHWQEFSFQVDGFAFDPDRVGQQVKLGAVEEWTVVNRTPRDHVFHIHINPFQLTKVNGNALAAPVWLDTAIVAGKGGSITFRSRFLDFTGKYVLHCHMMNHEALGMMQVVEVIP